MRHQYAQCDECPLKGSSPFEPYGPPNPKIAFVGEGSWSEGDSGSILWTHLLPLVGLSKSDVWITNVYLCAARSVQLETGAIMKMESAIDKAVVCCRKRLLMELQHLNPRVIVPLGKIACQAVTHYTNSGIAAYRGSITKIDFPDLISKATHNIEKLSPKKVTEQANSLFSSIINAPSMIKKHKRKSAKAPLVKNPYERDL